MARDRMRRGSGRRRARACEAHALERHNAVEAGICERVEQRGAALDKAHELFLLRGDTLDIVASVRLATPPGTGGGPRL